METDEIRHLELKSRHLQLIIREEQQRLANVQAQVGQERRRVSEERSSFKLLMGELKSQPKVVREPQFRLSVAATMAERLKQQKGKLVGAEQRLDGLSADAAKVQARIVAEEQKLDLVQSTLKTKKNSLRSAAEDARSESELETRLGRLHAEVVREDAIASDKDAGIEEETRAEERRTIENNDSVVIFSQDRFEALGDGAGQRGGEAGPYSGGESGGHSAGGGEGRGENQSHDRSARSAEETPRIGSEFANAVADIESWNDERGSGVSLTYVADSGRRLRIWIIGEGAESATGSLKPARSQAVQVYLAPESGNDRRVLWTERDAILRALAKDGYEVRSVAIGAPQQTVRS